jgi:hypothetical protein
MDFIVFCIGCFSLLCLYSAQKHAASAAKAAREAADTLRVVADIGRHLSVQIDELAKETRAGRVASQQILGAMRGEVAER